MILDVMHVRYWSSRQLKTRLNRRRQIIPAYACVFAHAHIVCAYISAVSFSQKNLMHVVVQSYICFVRLNHFMEGTRWWLVIIWDQAKWGQEIDGTAITFSCHNVTENLQNCTQFCVYSDINACLDKSEMLIGMLRQGRTVAPSFYSFAFRWSVLIFTLSCGLCYLTKWTKY